MTQEEELVIQCMNDPVFFAEHVLPDAIGPNFDSSKFLRLKWWQRDVLTAATRSKRITLRVRRQVGKSIASGAIALWRCAFFPERVTVIAPRQNQVENHAINVDHFIGHSPFLKALLVGSVKQPYRRYTFASGASLNYLIAGDKGEGVRSASGDWILLDEADYFSDAAFTAAMGLVNRDDISIIATTTIRGTRTKFYDWVHSGEWVDIHVHPERDPDFTVEDERRYRHVLRMTPDQYAREVECVWVDANTVVFRKDDVLQSITYDDWTYADYDCASGIWPTAGPCFLGVDWDKYGAGTNLVVVQRDDTPGSPTFKKLRVIWREEIPPSEFTLTKAVDRIIALNNRFKFIQINCDAGYGEAQIELLKKYGMDHPETRLDQTVNRIAFNENLLVKDPATGDNIKHQTKNYMVGTSRYYFEEGRIALCPHDDLLFNHLMDYKVARISDSGLVTFTDKMEHTVDAINLAIMAYDSRYGSLAEDTSPTMAMVGRLEIPTLQTFGIEDAPTGMIIGSRATRWSVATGRGILPGTHPKRRPLPRRG